MKTMSYRLLFSCCLISLHLSAQKKNEAYRLHISPTTSMMYIDGMMNEETWKNAEVADNFYMVSPMDTSYAHALTEVRMAYDEKNLYVLAICYKPRPGPQMVESLRRDFSFP